MLPIDLYEIIYQKILELRSNSQEIIIIGISGVDTAGKTHFSEKFSSYLKRKEIPTDIIHLDDFHNPQEVRYKNSNNIEAFLNDTFNFEKLIQDVLNPIKYHHSKETLQLNIDGYDFSTDSYGNKIYYCIHPISVIILEGIFLFRPPINDYLDLKIYLHIPFNEVIARARVRDVQRFSEDLLNRYQNKYIPAQKIFLERFHPMDHVDFCIDNINFNEPRIVENS